LLGGTIDAGYLELQFIILKSPALDALMRRTIRLLACESYMDNCNHGHRNLIVSYLNRETVTVCVFFESSDRVVSRKAPVV
jgi:hypothetical protein